MGILRDTSHSNGQSPPPEHTGEGRGPVDPGWAQPPPPGGEPELRRRRDALVREVAELHWDLGGLAYEMAIRDHFRLDVLVRRAAILQERDVELAEIERLLRGGPELAGIDRRTGTAMDTRAAASAGEQPTQVIHGGERPAAHE
jgi:hypothetical protein